MTIEIGTNLSSVLIAVVAIVPAIVAAYYAREAKIVAKEAKAQVGQTHDLVNSRMTELLELTRTASRAEGVKEATNSVQ